MGWAIGYLDGRDVGYGVPATCDYPTCKRKIDRGLAYKCGEWRTDDGCGLYFCHKHLGYGKDTNGDTVQMCDVCIENCEINRNDPENGWQKMKPTYDPKPDRPVWIRWKLKHHSWKEWRDSHPGEVEKMRRSLSAQFKEGKGEKV